MESENISNYNKCIEKLFNNFIDNNDIIKLDYTDNAILIPQISFSKINNATIILKKFFDNKDKIFDVYADSSGGMTAHIVFRKNDKIFIGFRRINYEGITSVYEIDRSFLNYINPDFTNYNPLKILNVV
jgi:hypothetical protein